MPELSAHDAALSAQEDHLFARVEAAYGSHPEFAASAQPIRDAIKALVRNPKALTPLFAFVGLLFPAAAPILAGIPALLALLTPSAPADPNATGAVQGQTAGDPLP
jgi:hypothetical protein